MGHFVVSDSPILQAALAYAAKGWPVFPCRAADSEELDAEGLPRWYAKAPLVGKWRQTASADAARIRNWWVRWPDALIGLPMGGATGLFALDFDPREEVDPETGEVISWTLAQLKADTEALMGCDLPQTVAQITPSKGVHAFFKQPADGGPAIRNRGNLPPHVDVRGEGGYVIVSPSAVLVSSKGAVGSYRWARGELPGTLAAEAPAALIELLRAGKSAPAGSAKELAESGNGANGIDVPGAAKGLSASEAVRRYGLSALDGETDALRRMGRGGRNKALNVAAVKLGSLVQAGALSEGVVRAALLDACHGNGLAREDGERACEATIDSGLKHGRDNPRDLREIEAEAERRAGRAGRRPMGSPRGRPAAEGRAEGDTAARTSPAGPAAASMPAEDLPEDEADTPSDEELYGPADPADPLADPPSDEESEDDESSQLGGSGDGGPADGEDVEEWCAWRPLTDLGNAERFKARFGQNYLYTVAGGWLVWDGRRWEPHFHGKPPRQLLLDIHQCVRAIRHEADAVSSKKRRGALLSWGRKSEAAGKINAIVGLFQPMVTVRDDVFDQDPLLFNVQNGTLRFFKDDEGFWGVERRDHAREDLITKVSPVAHDPLAACPHYDAFLAEMQPDPEVRDFLHRWDGLSLTGLRVQKLVQHYGTGRNGKGTMTELHAHIAGDYAGTMNIESLLATNTRSGQGSSPDIAKLPGVRFLRVSEPEEGSLLAEALVKRLTGGDPIDARHNYGPFFTFKPVFKLSFQSNYKMKIKGTDAGIWGRMRLVKWGVSVAGREDEGLGERLLAEASGVLNRLIAGALDYLQHGLSEPEAVKNDTAEYRDDSDPVGQFLALCVRPAPGTRIGSRSLHEVYSAWARWSGNVDRSGRPLSELKFGERMETANYKRIKSGSMFWLDIELVKLVSDFLDHEGNPLPVSDAATSPPPDAAADWEDMGAHGRTDREGW